MAGLIPQYFIDDLLERVDIVDVIDRRVTLKKSGKNFSACCPFHDEKTPSFSVNPDKQFYYCFGCGAGGNSIGFLMDYENLEFPAAVEALAAVAGIEVPREESDSGQNQKRRQQTQALLDLLESAARFYQQQLRQHSDKDSAVNYLKKRGLSGAVARDFAIGFAPDGWSSLLDSAEKKSGKKNIYDSLESCGLLVKKDNGRRYDFFRNRIIFPIRDNRGRVIAFGGRVLDDSKPKYLNSPESPVFAKQRELYGLYEARKANRQLESLLLVEGYMDVVVLVQHGITNAIATLGTASSHFHLEKIFRHTSRLVVCFDGDEAGRKAARRLLETALPTMCDGREICFLFLPAGEDPDSYVRQHGRDAFQRQVKDAVPLEQFLLDSAANDINLDSDAGKAKFSQSALPLIQKLPTGVFQQLMLRKLADATGVGVEHLEHSLGALTRKQTSGTHPPSAAAPTPDTDARKQPRADRAPPEPNDAHVTGLQKTPAIWAIAILLHHPELAHETTALAPAFDAACQSGELGDPDIDLLWRLISHIRSCEGSVTTYTLLGHWHGTPEAFALHNCASRHNPPDDTALAREELRDTLVRLLQEREDERLSTFIAQLKDKPPSSLTDEEKRELVAISSKLRKK